MVSKAIHSRYTTLTDTHCRDQELRFTVHDSPDYYKLKCSIFHEGPKTDLIGDAWIDLQDVIKLGGGRNDSWHQLEFKGKYAGDIRMELTFYDSREQPQEKRRKERSQTLPSESSSDLSLPSQRSLGPREIRRRPLPSSPASTPPIQTPNDIAQPQLPQPPPKLPLEEQRPLPHDLEYRTQHQSITQNRQIRRSSQHEGDHQIMPWQQPLGQRYLEHELSQSMQFNDPYQSPEPGHLNEFADQGDYSVQQHRWQPRPQSVHTYSEPVTPQQSQPLFRPSPASSNSDSQVARYHRHQQSDASPYGTPTYSSSPLKQSVSHHEIDSQPRADVVPPLPPKHRDTPPRRPKNEYPPSAYIPEPLRIGAQRLSVSERSPLQLLEDDYCAPRQEQSPSPVKPQTPLRQSMYVQLPHSNPMTPDEALQHYHRDNIPDRNVFQYDRQSMPVRPMARSRRTSYEIANNDFEAQVYDEPQPMSSYDHYVSYDEAHQPTVEDAPPSPGLQPVISRKAVGAQPKRINGMPFAPDAYDVLNPASSPATNENTMFETSEQAKEAQRLREVEKLRDLGPIIGNDGREIDPSDHLPSDTWAPEPERKNRKPEHVIHIRSKNDANRPTGARPSPIVIRNRGSAVTNLHSSPASVPQQQPTMHDSSPAARASPSGFIGGRNRLQKAPPAQTRPLPIQPYAAPAASASSPVVASSPSHMSSRESTPTRPLQPRHPSYDNRGTESLLRPALSEYQVPVTNSYKPRSSSQEQSSGTMKLFQYKATPTKASSQAYQSNYSAPIVESRRQSYDNRPESYDRRNSYDNRSDYSYENHTDTQRPEREQAPQKYYDDPLAAEMSLIDIGPSRHSYHQGSTGRSMARRW